MENKQNVNVENVETTTTEVENTQKELKIDIENVNSKDKNSNIEPIKKEVKEKITDNIILTPKQLSDRLERAKNKTKEEVAEDLKKEYEKQLNKTFEQLEETKNETFTIKENLAITRELFKNDIDNLLDDDEMEFLINKVKKEKNEDISYGEIIQKLKSEKPKYFNNNNLNIKTTIAPKNPNPIKTASDLAVEKFRKWQNGEYVE